MRPFTCASVNIGRSGGARESLSGIVHNIGLQVPGWACLVLPETDGFRDARPSPAAGFSNHQFVRHWPGEGSVALTVVVNQHVKHLLRSVCWRGRAGAFHFSNKSRAGQAASEVF